MNRIDRDENVGKRLLGLNLSRGVSPQLEFALRPDTDAADFADELQAAVVAAITETAKQHGALVAFVDEYKPDIHYSNIVLPREERERLDRENLASIQDSFSKGEEERQRRLAENPHNGKGGFWRVDGVRHDGVVWASSATEAVETAEKQDLVGSWERAEAYYIGETMPGQPD